MLNIYKDGDSIQLQTKVINITNSASFLFNFLHADFRMAELQLTSLSSDVDYLSNDVDCLSNYLFLCFSSR